MDSEAAPKKFADKPTYKIYGVNFSLYFSRSLLITDELIEQQIRVIAPYTNWVKTHTTHDGMQHTGRIAHENGMKAAIGAWITKKSNSDNNDKEINTLIELANASEADMAIIGGEVFLRKDLTEGELLEYIQKVKSSIPAGIPVTTAMTYREIMTHPNVIAAVDVIMFNYYPYFDGSSIEESMEYTDELYHRVMQKYPGKKIVFGEIGWPSEGQVIGNGIASPENARKYLGYFAKWARENNIEYFYFEAFDEPSKISSPCESHFGLWTYDIKTASSTLKPNMLPVFYGYSPLNY